MVSIYSNKKFKDLFFGMALSFIEIPFNQQLKSILKKGFSLKDGCLLFAENINKAKVSLSDFPDKTGYECFVNKIHIEDYVDSPEENLQDMCLQALQMLLETAKKVVPPLFKGAYRFILSIDQDDQDTYLNSYVFRFHTIRKKESYLEKELESYESAIIVLDINSALTDETLKNLSITDLLSFIEKSDDKIFELPLLYQP